MAKKFRFTLEGVRKVRAQERDARRRDVADAVRAASSVREQIGELSGMLQSTVEQTRVEQLEERLDMTLLRGHRSYQSHVQRRILELQEVLSGKEGELQTERASLADASKRLKAIEKLRDKRWLCHLAEVKREEQATSDEIAAQRYIRRSGEQRTLARAAPARTALQHPQFVTEDRA